MKTCIDYRGRVKISTKSKPTKGTKNSGTIQLFELFRDILAKNLIIFDKTELSKRLPSYIRLEYYKEGEDTAYLKSNKIPLTRIDISTPERAGVEYKGLLTYANIGVVEDEYIKYVKATLINALEEDNVLAVSELSEADLKNLRDIRGTLNSQATITWDMEIGNFEEK